METWRGLEDAQRMGIVKGIGLSNFNKQQLERVLKEGTIKPDAIQIEVEMCLDAARLLPDCKLLLLLSSTFVFTYRFTSKTFRKKWWNFVSLKVL